MESRDQQLCWVTIEALLETTPFPPRREERPPEDLVTSIRIVGVLSPVLARPTDEGLQLVCGFRRLHAARAAGLLRVPCLVSSFDDVEAIRCFLSENNCRRSRDDRELEESLELMKRLRDAGEAGEVAVSRAAEERELEPRDKTVMLPPDELREVNDRLGVAEREVEATLSSSRLPLDGVDARRPARWEVEDLVDWTRGFLDEVRRLRKVDVTVALSIVDEIIGIQNDTRVLRPQDVYRGDDRRWLAPHSVLSASLNLALAPDGSTGEERRMYALAGLLHDVGMVFFEGKDYVTSARVLTADQRSELRRHTWLGHALLSDLDPALEEIALAARDHHERAEGEGCTTGFLAKENLVTLIIDVLGPSEVRGGGLLHFAGFPS